jgi:hypothetical protein
LGGDNNVSRDHIEWQERTDRGQTFRHCSYCGSLHPEDILKIFELGGKLEGSDWKYGWAHKYYVEVPNPEVGKERVVGSQPGPNNTREPIMGIEGSTYTLKWYNEHLKDLLGQPEFEVLARVILDKFDGQFYPRVAFIDDGSGKQSVEL